jgi:hypothetical protein
VSHPHWYNVAYEAAYEADWHGYAASDTDSFCTRLADNNVAMDRLRWPDFNYDDDIAGCIDGSVDKIQHHADRLSADDQADAGSS